MAWPADLGWHLPEDFQPNRRTVLLIHGLESNIASMRPLQTAFERWGAQVIQFDFPNDGPIARSGDRLREALMEFQRLRPAVNLVVVVHSMGGLVARSAPEVPSDGPSCVSDLFLLGTPNGGSRLAQAQPWLELFTDVLPNLPRLHNISADGLGEAATDLEPGSRFFRLLNAHWSPGGVRYFCGIGCRSFLSDDERAGMERELTRIFDSRDVPDLTRRQLLDLLRSDELKDGKGDGAVTVRSRDSLRLAAKRCSI